jgi:quercetin dioxygenase-like cupin family protein
MEDEKEVVMSHEAQGVVVAPGDGREIPFGLGPNRLTFKIGPASGSQQLALFEIGLPPGAGAFIHRHRSYEEVFYVLEGEVTFRVDERQVLAAMGSYIFVPSSVVHGFKNTSAADARLLAIVTPGEGLVMMEELGRAHLDEIPQVLDGHDSEFIAPLW